MRREMHSRFRSYQLAVEFHRKAIQSSYAPHLREQMARAASSIVLNLSEGSARPSATERRRFYMIALGSVRECQSILELTASAPAELTKLADNLGAHVYRLTRARSETRSQLPNPGLPNP
jgi:four helix bundle protein